MRYIVLEICCFNWCVLQVEKGFQFLIQVNETIGQQFSQSKTVCLVNGTVKRCWFLFLFLSMERDLEEGQRLEDYSLDYVIEVYRNYVSVVYFLLGKEYWVVDSKGISFIRSGQFYKDVEFLFSFFVYVNVRKYMFILKIFGQF